MKKMTEDDGWVLMDTLTALLLGAVLLAALGPLLGRTAGAGLRLRQKAEKLIELRNTAGALPEDADEPR